MRRDLNAETSEKKPNTNAATDLVINWYPKRMIARLGQADDLLELGLGHGLAVEMLDLVKYVFHADQQTIWSLNKLSMTALCSYFGLMRAQRFYCIEELAIPGSRRHRILSIVTHPGTNEHVTGMGAANSLVHEAFFHAGVQVEYMAYRKQPYPEQHGDSTPYISALDLVANISHDGV